MYQSRRTPFVLPAGGVAVELTATNEKAPQKPTAGVLRGDNGREDEGEVIFRRFSFLLPL